MRGSRVIPALVITLLISASSQAQSKQWAIDLFAGTSNYQGDLMEKRYSMQSAKIALGFGGSYILNGHFRVRGLFSFAKIGANDKYATDPFLVARNLEFGSFDH